MSTLKSIIFETLPDPDEYWETAEALRDLDRQYQHFHPHGLEGLQATPQICGDQPSRRLSNTGDGSLCSSCVQRGKEVTNHRHLSFLSRSIPLLYLAEDGIKWTRFDVEAPVTSAVPWTWRDAPRPRGVEGPP